MPFWIRHVVRTYAFSASTSESSLTNYIFFFSTFQTIFNARNIRPETVVESQLSSLRSTLHGILPPSPGNQQLDRFIINWVEAA
jgi:hypothetical protein